MAYQKNAFEYLEETARRLPDKTAFADETQEVSFSALLAGALSVGTALYQLKTAENRRKAPAVVLADRSVLPLFGMFGALAAGIPYVPLDSRMPSDRLRTILETVQPQVLLCAEKDFSAAALWEDFCPVLAIEQLKKTEADAEVLRMRRRQVLDVDPVYMIFTSGSTGTPKGIVLPHRALLDFTEWMTETCGISETDILANQAPFYFDLSVKDVYQTLKTGCTTYILPKKCFLFPKLLVQSLQEHRVTALIWATSAFRMTAESGILEKEAPETVRKIILGGEALQARHLNRWKQALPGCTFINLYGPTEVTVDCTCYPITRDFADGEPIPIGRPCENMEILLLDEQLHPVPDGEAGEICVRGIGLALGYYNDPERTAAAFVQNPLCPAYPDRLYRTGDIGRIGEDGELYFLSRKDEQIKHMGFRIELGEIETALSALEEVQAAVCFFDAAADQIICCAVPTEPAFVETDLRRQLLQRLKERLPAYMLPNVWHFCDRLPLNANGKIDRVLLKERYRHG